MYGLKIITRKIDVRLSSPGQFIRQRIADVAAHWNRKGTMAARVELINEALCGMAALCYEQDSDGTLPNIDRATYRLLVPAPWGSSGWAVWGLRQHEGRTLRRILWARQKGWERGQRPLLFVYDDAGRFWYLNLPDYGSLDSAKWALRKGSITLQEWQKAALNGAL